MNKKGYIFVETIVTLTILMTLLVVLYNVFVNLFQKEKISAEYDKYGDKMALYYYKESTELKEGIFSTTTSPLPFNINNIVIVSCDNLKNNLKIVNIFNDEYQGLSQDFKKYINKFNKSCPKDGNQFLLLGEFRIDDATNGKKPSATFTYAHLYTPNY